VQDGQTGPVTWGRAHPVVAGRRHRLGTVTDVAGHHPDGMGRVEQEQMVS
jgi:hypothetical protein